MMLATNGPERNIRRAFEPRYLLLAAFSAFAFVVDFALSAAAYATLASKYGFNSAVFFSKLSGTTTYSGYTTP